MKRTIDMEAILSPIPGDNPAGEDLRYTPIYEEIKEARRADDPLDRGDWQREIKTADWDRVITTAVEALSKKSKDLQIVAWLMEALVNTEGFNGLAIGLRILHSFLKDYWEQVYPVIEEGDLEFRAAPLEFVNEKLSSCLKQVPLTDISVGPGYSWLKWKESRDVGYESNALTRTGEVDESKKKMREELIAEKKLTAEEFDSAAARSSKAYYQSLSENLTIGREIFKKLDQFVDEKFGKQAPRLSDFGMALEDCERVVMKIYKEQKGGTEPMLQPGSPKTKTITQQKGEKKTEERIPPSSPPAEGTHSVAIPPVQIGEFVDSDSLEMDLWEEALQILKTSGIKNALARLLRASNSAPSVRARTRYRLLMAKLCLEADRLDLARPIVEELNHLIEELHLERWESPLWIAEVLDALYQCLTRGQPSDDDLNKGKALFERLCRTDVTKAIIYKR